ncbi:hypothetical protein CSIM01_09690 [Colletotrichum simmondsii]|uniref:Uncharacterized protein n=1 Tax=Colletotrichum simmondsii TaxID=703756 RepID=A0A135TBP5_9PEZI|nr:hypothetical protein CSIM01_09690 [Colletotrichum simmondsii]
MEVPPLPTTVVLHLPSVTHHIRHRPDQLYVWGFYLHRTTYRDQDLWERYVTYLRECMLGDISYDANATYIRPYHRLSILEDPELDGMSIWNVMLRFQSWAGGLSHGADPEQEIPIIEKRDHSRFGYCLIVDDDCLKSFEAQTGKPAINIVYIKAVDCRPFARHSSDDEGDDPGSGKHDQEDEDSSWMLVSCNFVCSLHDMLDSGFEWERQSRSVRYPKKRPWDG